MKRKPPKRKRVSETFESKVWVVQGTDGIYAYLDMNSPRLKKRDWIDGDRVRVKVTKLERGK